MAVSSGGRTAPLRTALNVPASAELDDLFSYEGFLAELAEGKPRGGEPGRLIQSSRGIADTEGLLKTNVFRPGVAPARSRDAVWPVVIFIASALFLGDVVCRRVIVSFDWLPPIAQSLPWKKAAATNVVQAQRLERLKSIKENATSRFDQSVEFVPGDVVEQSIHAAATSVSDEQPQQAIAAASAEPSTEESVAGSDFTSRLLQAKRRVHERDQRPRE